MMTGQLVTHVNQNQMLVLTGHLITPVNHEEIFDNEEVLFDNWSVNLLTQVQQYTSIHILESLFDYAF